MINVHSWDLKSLAFQAKTSVGLVPAGRPGPPWTSGPLRLASRAEVFGFLNPDQSGFQPTAEPTAFQAVVVQLVSVPDTFSSPNGADFAPEALHELKDDAVTESASTREKGTF